MSNRIACPHCGNPVRTITSHQMSPLVREIYYDCTNLLCLHRFVAQLGIVRTVAGSLMPKEEVRLPLRSRQPNEIQRSPHAGGRVARQRPRVHRSVRMRRGARP